MALHATNVPTDATPGKRHGEASSSPNKSQLNPQIFNDRRDESATSASRPKINISLKKKPKPSSSNQKLTSTASTSVLLADEYTTIAEEAEIISRRRQEDGTVLVIPCNQSQNIESDSQQNKQPLLARRLASVRMQQREEGKAIQSTMKADSTDIDEDFNNHEIDDEMVLSQLIQSAEQACSDKEHLNSFTNASTSNKSMKGVGGLVISAPSQNKLNLPRKNNDIKDEEIDAKHNEMTMYDDDELFKRELTHHAADVEPTSTMYANVAIHDFGSALLRGMGWTGGSESSKGDEKQEIRPRPHRLGLGATPLLPLPNSSGQSSQGAGGMIHRRARRPHELKRDEDRRRKFEEAEKRDEQKKRLDVQYTLQKGSIVHVFSHNGDNAQDAISGRGKSRAIVIQTSGVPGLNRILIQIEGSSAETSVTKQSVSLCSWEELETDPFDRSPLMQKMRNNPKDEGSAQGYLNSHHRHDNKRKRSNYGDDNSSHGRDRYQDSRRSRSGNREMTDNQGQGQYRDESCNRGKSHNHMDKKCPTSHDRNLPFKDSRSLSQKQQQQLHWLIPNIRVRLISKKLPKYYLQKGVVQDVLRSNSHKPDSHGAPKATLLMDDGQVLDKVPERYLETALPKTGGNVIVLEGTNHIRWKLGRLLERSSKDGQGIIQLEEDLDVVKVSLDSIAEWCG